MNLLEFIASDDRNLWIIEPGIEYYVRKSLFFEGAIELANCRAISDGTIAGFWKFMRRYQATIPFVAEQVLNDDLVKWFRKEGGRERDIGGIPQFASPLLVDRFRDTRYFTMLYGDG